MSDFRGDKAVEAWDKARRFASVDEVRNIIRVSDDAISALEGYHAIQVRLHLEENLSK